MYKNVNCIFFQKVGMASYNCTCSKVKKFLFLFNNCKELYSDEKCEHRQESIKPKNIFPEYFLLKRRKNNEYNIKKS